MVDYNPTTSAPAQVLPFEDLPSTDTPVTAAWLNHVDDVLEDIAADGGRIEDLEAIPISTQTGTSYTLVLGDARTIVRTNNAAANTLTVPPNSSVAFPAGIYVSLLQYGAGQTTVVAGSGVTIHSRGNALKLSGQFAEASLTKLGTNEWLLSGDITL